MPLAIGTLAAGKLGTSLASLYSPSVGFRSHVLVSLANTSTGSTYTVNVGVKRMGTTTTYLIAGAGTLIIASNSTNTSSGRLMLPDNLTGLKLSAGDSLMGSAGTDAVVDYVIFGGEETST